MKSVRAFLAAILAGLLVVLAIGRLVPPPVLRLHTRDLNRDGRPDLWQYYDEAGTLVRESIDTNFDGKADVQQSYHLGRLVRRELDRNFDDRVDLTDEFDPKTGEHTRSTFDVDFDGRADLLVLFSNGEPAFSEWAPREPPAALAFSDSAIRRARGPDEPLRSFDDPFATTRRLQAGGTVVARSTAYAGCRSLPVARRVFTSATRVAAVPLERSAVLLSWQTGTRRPRGPPLPL